MIHGPSLEGISIVHKDYGTVYTIYKYEGYYSAYGHVCSLCADGGLYITSEELEYYIIGDMVGAIYL